MGLQKNVASQYWIVFAFDRTDNTPKTGDASNITANLRIDGGNADAIDDTNPTELEDGFYRFDLTQAETNGDDIVICPASSTGNIQVIGCPMAVWTTDIDAIIGYLYAKERGRWKITGNQLIYYAVDNVTPLRTFNLFDSDGNPTNESPYERVPV